MGMPRSLPFKYATKFRQSELPEHLLSGTALGIDMVGHWVHMESTPVNQCLDEAVTFVSNQLFLKTGEEDINQ